MLTFFKYDLINRTTKTNVQVRGHVFEQFYQINIQARRTRICISQPRGNLWFYDRSRDAEWANQWVSFALKYSRGVMNIFIAPLEYLWRIQKNMYTAIASAYESMRRPTQWDATCVNTFLPICFLIIQRRNNTKAEMALQQIDNVSHFLSYFCYVVTNTSHS